MSGRLEQRNIGLKDVVVVRDDLLRPRKRRVMPWRGAGTKGRTSSYRHEVGSNAALRGPLAAGGTGGGGVNSVCLCRRRGPSSMSARRRTPMHSLQAHMPRVSARSDGYQTTPKRF